MPTYSVGPEIIAFYSETISESDRLSSSADGVLELIRTQELLRRHLPAAPARIIDIGSGPGAHARWLVKDGYELDLIDPVPRHVDEAAASGFRVSLGDARALAAADASYDVALVLGPLYHLLDHDDRIQALREAARVVRPGGLVAAAAIGRYASLFEHVATTMLTVDRVRDAVADILVSGIHEAGRKGFTSSYFHTGESLAAEMRRAGLDSPVVYGVEGPAWSALKATEQHTGDSLIDSRMFDAALTAARLAEPHPDLLAASSHMLAVATVPA
ncbi:class I SAM-dependent methyltransferase [Streptomyces katrae]|uniref:Class I SAM-dependent methyltransferase n=1 Tax=Streptomyces katrae TaxID=68223 RepID=A0ABT7GSL3_9ACTN|nr:class I SAM-dependent methyltransferase [Streptomyces katrae]MDK9496586.1 class I SAM-dependent methyltransferase [Streptomyces katrae]